MYIHYVSLPGNQTEPKKVFSFLWIWCDSVRDLNLPLHTRIDFVLPNVSKAHSHTDVVGFPLLPTPKVLIPAVCDPGAFNCDVIPWRLSPSQYWCKINPPKHDITLTWSAFISTACLWLEGSLLWCQILDSRRPRVAPSEARSLGSLALRVRADTDHWEVFMYAIECCNKV